MAKTKRPRKSRKGGDGESNSLPVSPRLGGILSRTSSSTGSEGGASVGEPWTLVGKQSKKRKRNRPNGTASPSFAFNATDLRGRSEPVSLAEVRTFVAALMAGAESSVPKFIVPSNANLIRRWAVFHIPGMTPDILGMPPQPPAAIHQPTPHPSSMFLPGQETPVKTDSDPLPPPSTAFPIALGQTSENKLPAMNQLFSHGCPTKALGDYTRINNVINSMLSGPTLDNQRKKKDTTKVSLKSLVLGTNELLRECYPIPSYLVSSFPKTPDTPDGFSEQDLSAFANGWTHTFPPPVVQDSEWVETPQATVIDDVATADPMPIGTVIDDAEALDKPKAFAIDCEMVQTAIGQELAHISVVEFWTGEPVYDELVKPTNPITDHLTQWSGLTAALLEPITTTLSDVQKHLITLFGDSRTILIGHSLNSDLRVLKLAHPSCIDTSVAFQHPRGPPSKPSLKWLAGRWIGREIQVVAGSGSGGRVGHDPKEDALACVDLIKKKLTNGYHYGRFDLQTETLFEVASKAEMKSAYIGTAGLNYGSKATTIINCNSDEAVMDNAITTLKTHEFVFGRMQQLSHALGWTRPISSPSSPTTVASPPLSSLPQTLSNLNTQLLKLTTLLPPYTAVLILTGLSDPTHISILNRKKSHWDSMVRAGKQEELGAEERWSSREGRDLDDLVEGGKRGLGFFCITLPRSGGV